MKDWLKFSREDEIVWKIKHDPASDILVLEWRSEVTREVSFSAIQLPSAKVLWDAFQTEEKWWVNLVGIYNGKLLIHELEEESKVPLVKKLVVVDILSAEVLWSLDGYLFEDVQESFFVLRKVTQQGGVQELICVDTLTGKTVSEKPILGVDKNEDDTHIIAPLVYDEENEHFATFQKFLLKKLQALPYKSVGYREHDGNIFIDYHEKQENGLKHKIVVLSEKGEILLKDELNSGTEMMSSSSFVIINAYLIYIKDKSELVCYKIN